LFFQYNGFSLMLEKRTFKMMINPKVKRYLVGLVIILFSQMILGNISEALNMTSSTQDKPSELVSALVGEDAVARFMAEEQLVEMGDTAVPVLKPLATSPGFTPARQYAINILARIESQKAIELLLRVLEQEQDVKVRALICRHLGRLGVEEAVPIIGKWLFTIQGKSLDFLNGREPQGTQPWYAWIVDWYAWIVHVQALREIGSEEGIPILEELLKTGHGGRAGHDFMMAYEDNLRELRKEAAFWNAVRRTPGLEEEVRLLFRFFRRDSLAAIRLYRDKVIHLGLEGRWVLEDMRNHPDKKLQQAAAALLKAYDNLQP
jgi:hypothetical protein